jgi:type IV secretory pathway VirB10-like protein
MLNSLETTKPSNYFMKSNKSKITLTVIAIALAIFALTQCQSKDATVPATTPAVAPVETQPVVAEKAPEPVAPKAVQPSPAPAQPKPVEKKEKAAPAAGSPPEHRPIF